MDKQTQLLRWRLILGKEIQKELEEIGSFTLSSEDQRLDFSIFFISSFFGILVFTILLTRFLFFLILGAFLILFIFFLFNVRKVFTETLTFLI